MEYFIPEQEFEKADFKGKKISPPEPCEASSDPQKASSRKVGGPNSQKERPRRPSPPADSSRPLRKGKDITQIMGLGKAPAKSDEPEARSYRLRDAGGKIISDAAKKDASPPSASPVRKKSFSLPKPQTPREARKIALQEAHMPDAFHPARLSREEIERNKQAQKANSSAPLVKAHPPIPKELGILGEAVLLNLAGARHVLRRWYWEKSGQADPSIAFVPPHERIHIALKLCGMAVLQKLFSTMSPKEREQMVEILKRPLNVPASYSAAVQSAFMQAMSEQQSWS